MCEQDFFRRTAAAAYFQTALQLGMPQWNPTHGAAVRAGRDCIMAADALPFAANSMDLLLLPHGLETPCREGVLREAYRVLAAEGRLVLSGFNPHSVWRLLYRSERKSFPNQENCIAIGRLKTLWQDAGFEAVQTEWLVCWPLAAQPDTPQKNGWPAAALVYAAVLMKRQAGVHPLGGFVPAVLPEWDLQGA
ncbi:class I SAM-dependent methyltransferase [Kingella potus]|uniref:class I SAM-dependent methyltransferase n=1 Tax=Kingella potus TaxID=265175 RepID=UPI001FD09591|nr:methyltransferase domain-containing protein [Kingella potus]UOP00102.1 class I SAM-dependent methyltransferase [Kingella potus]